MPKSTGSATAPPPIKVERDLTDNGRARSPVTNVAETPLPRPTVSTLEGAGHDRLASCVRHDLCQVCDGLGLSIQRFVVSNIPAAGDASSDPGSLDAPIPNRGPRPARDGEPGNMRLDWGRPRTPFASFSELQVRARQKCRLCDLIVRAVQRYSGNRVDGTATLSLRWEFDSWENANHNAGSRTRRIRLAWRERHGGREMVVYLLFCGSAPAPAAQPSPPDTGNGMLEKQDLLKGWLDACVTQHGPRCQAKHGDASDFRKLVEGTYFGVIDVRDMQLKPLPVAGNEPSRYVALSYVWGNNARNMHATTRSSVMLHIQHNGLQKVWDKLPKTIQDAILLVRQLGERYLWVDSLCIVQDSSRSWELNARSMHLVYGNAHFTICAADGAADAGLMPGAEEDGGGGRCFPALLVEVVRGIRLLATRPAEAIIQDSCWSRRGWTFQERLLSRRCLIFADGQLYFQCRSSVASQHTSGSVDGLARNWSLDWANSPTRMLRELHRKTFWVYMNCVALYTGRRLTKPKDVLAAFSGISWLLQEHMNAPLLYGLPTSHFDLALLWAPAERLDLRRKTGRAARGAAASTRDELGSCPCRVEEEEYGDAEFPSWSWAGWQNGKAEYRSDMLEGSLHDVQDWLKNHTWIQWYVRDREGHLRPLWDRKVLRRDGSEVSSWRGYAGKPPSPATVTAGPYMWSPNAHDASQAPSSGEAAWSPWLATTLQKTLAELGAVSGQPSRPQPALWPTFQASQPNGENSPVADQQPVLGSILSGAVLASGGAPQGLASLDLTQSPAGPESVPASPQMLHGNGVFRRESVGTRDGDYFASQRAAGSEPGRGGTNDQDDYGRPLREALKGRNTSNFTGVLADNPFGIIQRPLPEEGIDHARAMPILQFWTWRTELYVTARAGTDGRLDDDDDGTAACRAANAPPHPRALVQCDVSDRSGDWCGAIALPSAGVAALGERAAAAMPFHFVALSEAKAFTADECPVWNYYNSRERDDSEWDLYFVMLLQRNKVTALWERVAVGKVFQAAFRDAKWSEVKLG